MAVKKLQFNILPSRDRRRIKTLCRNSWTAVGSGMPRQMYVSAPHGDVGKHRSLHHSMPVKYGNGALQLGSRSRDEVLPGNTLARNAPRLESLSDNVAFPSPASLYHLLFALLDGHVGHIVLVLVLVILLLFFGHSWRRRLRLTRPL